MGGVSGALRHAPTFAELKTRVKVTCHNRKIKLWKTLGWGMNWGIFLSVLAFSGDGGFECEGDVATLAAWFYFQSA